MSSPQQMEFALGINKMDADDLCVVLMLLKTRAAKLGLFQTVKSLDGATQKIGWELAERYQASKSTAAQL